MEQRILNDGTEDSFGVKAYLMLVHVIIGTIHHGYHLKFKVNRTDRWAYCNPN